MFKLSKTSRSLYRIGGTVRRKTDFKTFRENWLNDPGLSLQTYPIIALMGFAILLPLSFGVHYLMTSHDVDLLKKRRPFQLRYDQDEKNQEEDARDDKNRR